MGNRTVVGAILMSFAIASGAFASNASTALPPNVAAQLAKGRKLDMVWRAEGFVPSRGFKAGSLEWKSEERIGEISSYLKEQMTSFGTKGGFYTVDFVVVEAKPGKIGAIFNKSGFFVLEGTVKDTKGQIQAAFRTRQEDELAGFGGGRSFKPAVDRALSGIQGELFN